MSMRPSAAILDAERPGKKAVSFELKNARRKNALNDDAGTDESISVSELVRVFHALLDLHEVKLCFELLSHIGQSSLGSESLPFDKSQLKDAVHTCPALTGQSSDGIQCLLDLGLVSEMQYAQGASSSCSPASGRHEEPDSPTHSVESSGMQDRPRLTETQMADNEAQQSASLSAHAAQLEQRAGDGYCMPKTRQTANGFFSAMRNSVRRPDGSISMSELTPSCAALEEPISSTRMDQFRPYQSGRSVTGSQTHRESEAGELQGRGGRSQGMEMDAIDEDNGTDFGSALPEGDSGDDVKRRVSQARLFNKSGWGFGTRLLIIERNAPALATRSNPWIIHPNHPCRLAWDLLAFVLIIMESVAIPLSWAFDMQPSEAVFWFTTAFFCTDIVLSSVTGCFINGILVMHQSIIFRRYLFGFFLIDVVSTVPWEVALGAHGGDGAGMTSLLKAARFVKLVRFMRLLRLVKVRDLLARLEDLLPSASLIFCLSLLKMLGLFALLVHWCSCVWGFIGDPAKIGHHSAGLEPHDLGQCEPQGPCENSIFGSPWQRRYGVDQLSADEKYVASLVFATGLITGGDTGVTPGYIGERLYVIIMMVVSFLLMATILSEIVVLFERMSKDTCELQDTVRAMKGFMTTRKVPLMMQAKIKQYLEFQHKAQKNGTGQEQLEAIINHLSPWLKLELSEHLNSATLSRHPFFQTLPESVFTRLCSLASVVLCAPGDTIMQRGYRASCMCFIVKGQLRVLTPGASSDKYDMHDDDPSDHSRGIVLQNPSWIGDVCLFQDGLVRSSTVVSLTHSELLTVSREAVLQLLHEFPKAQSAYDEFKRLVEEKGSSAVKCEYCGGLGHMSADCPEAELLAKEKQINHRGTKMKNMLMRTATKVLRITKVSSKGPNVSNFSGGAIQVVPEDEEEDEPVPATKTALSGRMGSYASQEDDDALS